MDHLEFKAWFAGAKEELSALFQSFKAQYPPIDRIAVIRAHEGAEPRVALYLWGSRQNKKIAAIASRVPPSVVVNNKTVALEVFDLKRPTAQARDERIKYGASVSPEKAKEYNDIIQQHGDVFIKGYSNVSMVMPVVVGEEINIVVTVFHADVLMNDDAPIPSSVCGIPTLVREGGMFTLEGRIYAGYESDE